MLNISSIFVGREVTFICTRRRRFKHQSTEWRSAISEECFIFRMWGKKAFSRDEKGSREKDNRQGNKSEPTIDKECREECLQSIEFGKDFYGNRLIYHFIFYDSFELGGSSMSDDRRVSRARKRRKRRAK